MANKRHIKSNRFTGVYFENLENGDKSYYITFKDENNKLKWLKIGLHSEGIREPFCYQKRNEYVTKIRLGEAVQHKAARKSKLTFGEVFKEYIESIRATKKSFEKDETNYNLYLSHLKDKDIGLMDHKEFESLRDKLVIEKRLSDRSINYVLATARQIYTYAIKNNYYKEVNPLSKVKMLKLDNAKIGFFTKEEAEQVITFFEKYNKLLYRLTVLLLHTGGRFSEVASLTWNDINLNQKSIYFKKTKDGNARHIAMSERVEKIIAELKQEQINELVIPSPVTQKQIGQMPKQWQEAVDSIIEGNRSRGKAKLTTHSLRHTHASWLAIEGLDIAHIKEQLGHKSIATTMRYAHLIPNKRNETTKKIF